MFLHLRFVIFFFNLIASCFGVLAETRLVQGVQIRRAALVHKRSQTLGIGRNCRQTNFLRVIG